MSRIKYAAKRLYLVLAFFSLFFSVFANEWNLDNFSSIEIEQRLENLNLNVDFRLTPEVKKYLNQYTNTYRQSSETLIGRSMIYFPVMESKIYEKNMPIELMYLSVIESSLKPSARSRVGAVGLWQFMRPTARMYGLKMDRHVDERRDVEKSTDAALKYLTDLYERFGDWTLALAAYNCGPGNVKKAMRRSGGNDYWSIRKFLPRETRNYLPKFIAIAYLMNYYADHDLEPEYPESLFIKTRKAIVYNGLSFKKLSNITGIDVSTIQFYNPSYVGNYIPKSSNGKILVLPSNEMFTYLEAVQGFERLIPDPHAIEKEEIVEEEEDFLAARPLIEISPISVLNLVLKGKKDLESTYSNGFDKEDIRTTRIREKFSPQGIREHKRRRLKLLSNRVAQNLVVSTSN